MSCRERSRCWRRAAQTSWESKTQRCRSLSLVRPQKRALALLCLLSLVSYWPLAPVARVCWVGRLNCDALTQLSSIHFGLQSYDRCAARHCGIWRHRGCTACTAHRTAADAPKKTKSRAARPVAAEDRRPRRVLPARRRRAVLVQGTPTHPTTTDNLAARPPPAHYYNWRRPREPVDRDREPQLVPHGQAR